MEKKKKVRKVQIIFLLCLICLVQLTACGKQKQEGSYCYNIYYVSKEKTHVVSEEYYTDTSAEDMDKLLGELIGRLRDNAQKPEYIVPLSDSFQEYMLNEGQINLDFNESYRNQETISEILCRAAVVRTLTQVEGIDVVTFSISGETLTDSMGIPVGAMAADSFIDNAGTEINAYAEAEFHLYFADETGTRLVEVDREVVYNSNISMEKQVMDELIKGPAKEEASKEGNACYPTINPATSVLGVTVKDGVCYVNLSRDFLTQTYNVTPEVTIYSIANSMAELADVNKVQITIDGESDVNYSDGINLATIFERNLDIVKK